MPSTEIEVLKFIWENKGKASWFRIVKELRFFSPDYCRLICQSLIKKKFVEFSEGQYKITGLGKRELERLGLTPKESFRLPTGQVEKAVRPKKLRKPKKFKKPKKIVAKKKIKGTPFTELTGFTPKLIEEFKKKGLRTLEDIATTSVVKLEGIEGLTLGEAAKIINETRDKLRKEGKEYLWEQ